MRCVISLHEFRANTNNIIVKECSIATVDGKGIYHWVVKSPFDFTELNRARRRDAHHVTQFVHGLKWEDGEVEYRDWKMSLLNFTDKASTIYAKGTGITKLLSQLTGTSVINLEDMGCPSLKDLTGPPLKCLHHTINNQSDVTCTLKNVISVRDSLINYEHLSHVSGTRVDLFDPKW